MKKIGDFEEKVVSTRQLLACKELMEKLFTPKQKNGDRPGMIRPESYSREAEYLFPDVVVWEGEVTYDEVTYEPQGWWDRFWGNPPQKKFTAKTGHIVVCPTVGDNPKWFVHENALYLWASNKVYWLKDGQYRLGCKMPRQLEGAAVDKLNEEGVRQSHGLPVARVKPIGALEFAQEYGHSGADINWIPILEPKPEEEEK